MSPTSVDKKASVPFGPVTSNTRGPSPGSTLRRKCKKGQQRCSASITCAASVSRFFWGSNLHRKPPGICSSPLAFVKRLRTAEHWLYRCIVVDWYSGVVVGWSMSPRQDR